MEAQPDKSLPASDEASVQNPFAFLGLKRVDADDEQEAESPSKIGMELNRRGIPARKRKRNSLIYGNDDLVSIPVKSPRKRGTKEQHSKSSKSSTPLSSPVKVDEAVGFVGVEAPSPEKRGSKRSPKKRLNFDEVASKKKDAKPPAVLNRSNSGSSMPKGSPRRTAVKVKQEPGEVEILSSPEKKHAQTLGVSLRNLLKLPKAHKWVCFEFFYSNLDKILFEGENDFMVCLRESFPHMKTRRLTRVEWCKIRRMMGRPRRCSSAFFAEERAELTRKRSKIRLLQQRKQGEVINFKDLPENIPLQLTIGTRVTARLRKPQDGLFMGSVDAYDTSNNTYRVRFDRPGLGGTHSVMDDEVLSVEAPETVPLTSFMTRVVRPKPMPQQPPQQPHPQPFHSVFGSPIRVASSAAAAAGYHSNFSPQLANDPLLSGGSPRGKLMRMDGQLGGYPVKFLEQVVRLSKILKKKRNKIGLLRELNSAGERKKSFGAFISEDFQQRYASTVIDLSNINRDLNEHLKSIQDFTQEFALEAGPTISLPNIIREGCQEDAYDMVNKNNNSSGDFVEDPKTLALISSFTSLMLHIKQLSDGERNSFELEAFQDAIQEVKNNISANNAGKFENCVEVHMKHIQSGLSQMGNLHAFMKAGSSSPAKSNGIAKVKDIGKSAVFGDAINEDSNDSSDLSEASSPSKPCRIVRSLKPILMADDQSS